MRCRGSACEAVAVGFALTGPSLTLRPPQPGDAEALLELASDPEVTRWFSWGPYTDIEQPREYIERCAWQRERGEQLDLLIIDREKGPAGITGLSELSYRDRRCIVGTWLGADFWGTQVNRESKAMIAYLGFELLGMNRIGSYSNPENERSTSALEAVGYSREGVLSQWHRHGERYLDVNIFGMLRDDWRASEQAEIEISSEGTPPSAFLQGL